MRVSLYATVDVAPEADAIREDATQLDRVMDDLFFNADNARIFTTDGLMGIRR